jgi:hypothetical protein
MINANELTTTELDEIGLRALLKALGPTGMVRFLRQHERGRGDYTKERHEWLDKIPPEEFAASVLRRQRARKRATRHSAPRRPQKNA